MRDAQLPDTRKADGEDRARVELAFIARKREGERQGVGEAVVETRLVRKRRRVGPRRVDRARRDCGREILDRSLEGAGTLDLVDVVSEPGPHHLVGGRGLAGFGERMRRRYGGGPDFFTGKLVPRELRLHRGFPERERTPDGDIELVILFASRERFGDPDISAPVTRTRRGAELDDRIFSEGEALVRKNAAGSDRAVRRHFDTGFLRNFLRKHRSCDEDEDDGSHHHKEEGSENIVTGAFHGGPSLSHSCLCQIWQN